MIDYYIGIDAGGSKSEAALCDQDLKLIARNRFEGLNLRGLNPNIAASQVKRIIEQLTYQGGILPYHVKLTVLAAAGAGEAKTREQVEASCYSYMPTQAVKVITDTEAALAGAFKDESGIVVIAGTGSIAYGSDAEGNLRRAGGYGYILGDKGSGFWIGRQGLKICLDAHFNGKKVKWAEEIYQMWELSNIEEALEIIYKLEKPAAKIAEIAPIVMRAAVEGSDEAKSIIASAGEKLCELIYTLADRLYLEGKTKVCLLGGIFKDNSPVKQEVIKHSDSSRFEFSEPLYEPAVGAIIHGRNMCGI